MSVVGLNKIPRAAARRIRKRRHAQKKWGGLNFSGLAQAISGVGTFSLALYLAFFSPFSQAVEGQLRSEVAEKAVEKLRLTDEVVALDEEIREKEIQLVQQGQELAAQRIELARTESDHASAAKALAALQIESADLQTTLRMQYRNEYVRSLPAMWGENKVPKVWADALNGILKGTAISPSTIGREVYLTSVQSLQSEDGAHVDSLRSRVAHDLREEIGSRCGDENAFAARFISVSTTEAEQDDDDRGGATAIQQATRLFRETCLAP